MESAGPTPHAAVDLSDLVPLLTAPGPVATVYLTTEAEIDNAAQRSEQRWRTLRRTMADDGVPEPVLAAIDPLVPEAHLDGQTLAVIAGGDGVRLVDHFPEPPQTDGYRWGSLPWIGPVLEERQGAVAHVIVTIDRTGADLVLVRPGGDAVEREVSGDPSAPVSKSAPGGWSQRRYQQRAENTWQDNAGNVADEVANLVRRGGGRIVIVAGDVRAVQLLRDALPAEVLELVEVTDSDPAQAAVRAVDTAVARGTVELLEKFKEEKGQADRAADGVRATVDALNRSQVEVLLVHADPDDQRTAWFGADPVPVSLDPGELKDLGVDSPTEGPLVDVLIRAAAGTGATVRMIPHAGPVQDNTGAILRWSS